MFEQFIRAWYRSSHRGQRRPTSRLRFGPMAERLESRQVLAGSGMYGTHAYETLTRFANGTWVAIGVSGDTIETHVIATWDPRGKWHLDQIADFDGDDIDDIAARDARTGTWTVALSDGTTSRSVVAGKWSTAVTWRDVKAIDWDGDQRDDIVGRASNGKWYAQISNGDGTFTNRLIGSWAASAGWTDTQWLDFDRDGDPDILSRSRTGQWRVGLNIAGFELENHVVGGWTAGTWKDVGMVDLEYDYRPEIVGRNAKGEWWASKIHDSSEPGVLGSLVNHVIGSWDESLAWKDVRFGTPFTYGGGDKGSIVGRTAAGEWWASSLAGWSLDDVDARLEHRLAGHWDPAGKWRDVHVASSNGDTINEIIGRNASGEWWSIDWPGSWAAETAVARRVATTTNHTSIRRVLTGRFTWSPVSLNWGQLAIRASRGGAEVTVDETGSRIEIAYTSEGSTREWAFARDTIDHIEFRGSTRNDAFFNNTAIRSFASGLQGDDVLQGGRTYDYLDGGEGEDTLYGSGNDSFEGGEGIDRIDKGFGLVGDDSLYDPYQVAKRGSGDLSDTSYNDIQQGAYGNCYFWAALGAVANAGNDLASNIRYKGGTSFEVKLFFKDRWTWVATTFEWQTGTYDDDNNGDPRMPHDDWRVASEKDCWQLIYWRAWNKITNEGENGNPATVMPSLTGIRNQIANWSVGSGGSENAIRSAINSGHAVVTSTGATATATQKKGSLDPLGRVVANHAYTVIAASSDGLTLFNPWRVDGNWEVFDIDKNKTLSPSERATYNQTAVDGQDDGIFQISWVDWRRYYEDYSINPC